MYILDFLPEPLTPAVTRRIFTIVVRTDDERLANLVRCFMPLNVTNMEPGTAVSKWSPPERASTPRFDQLLSCGW